MRPTSVLAGHSIGGMTIQTLAIARPGRGSRSACEASFSWRRPRRGSSVETRPRRVTRRRKLDARRSSWRFTGTPTPVARSAGRPAGSHHRDTRHVREHRRAGSRPSAPVMHRMDLRSLRNVSAIVVIVGGRDRLTLPRSVANRSAPQAERRRAAGRRAHDSARSPGRMRGRDAIAPQLTGAEPST